MDFDGDGNPNVHEYWNGTDYRVWNPTGAAGCYYWGEGDGDGYTGPGDISTLNTLIKNGPANYFNVVPSNNDTQEMDMDLYRGPADLSILNSITKNTTIVTLGSRPTGLEVVYPSAPVSVAVGETTRVTVSLRNTNGFTTPGFGIVFEIDTASTGAATLLGGDGAKDGWRYDITGPIAPGSPATIYLRIDAPGTIIIRAWTPQCGVGGVGRYCVAQAADPVTITGN